LHGSEKGSGPFCITGGNPPPTFEVEDGVFHQMTKFVEIPVVIALDDPVLFGRNHRDHGLPRRLFEESVGVVAPVGQKIVCGYSFDEAAGLRAIRGGT
jgi:hypothetical protein